MRLRNRLLLVALATVLASCGGRSDVQSYGSLPPSGPPAADTLPAAEVTPPDPGMAGAPFADASGRSSNVAPPMPSTRYDAVGYATVSSSEESVTAAHATLPIGSYAEITSLSDGRTILVPITAATRGKLEIGLSSAAARALGIADGGKAAVRVRASNAGPVDMQALAAGQLAAARPNAPPVLLSALRAKLAGTLGRVTADFDTPPAPGATPRKRPTPATRSPATTPPPAAADTAGLYVQVAALADRARAEAAARAVGGSVQRAGTLYRVRVGPFAERGRAQAARDDLAKRGYGGAVIVRQD